MKIRAVVTVEESKTYNVTMLRLHLIATHGATFDQAERLAPTAGPCPACKAESAAEGRAS